MKKGICSRVSIVLSILLFSIAGHPVFGQQHSPVIIEMKTQLTSPHQGILVQELDFKPGFTRGTPVRVRIDGETRLVYPLINIDVAVIARAPIGLNRAVIMPLPDTVITVKIPFSFIKEMTGGKLEILSALVFWDPASQTWQSASQLKDDLTAPTIDRDNGIVKFDIKRWPLDDRFIGCY